MPTLAEPEIAGRVGRLLIHDYFVGETEEATDELLVGSPNILVEVAAAEGRRRFIVHLESWGAQFITFSTTLSLAASAWQALFEANPIPGNFSESPAPPGYVAANVRSFRRQLVNNMFDLPNTLTVPPATRTLLTSMASTMSAQNSVLGRRSGHRHRRARGAGGHALPRAERAADRPRPDARVAGNRILGFVQGIHVATSRDQGVRGLSYHVTVADNVVHLRVPGLAGQRHGIFVGSVYHLRVEGNTVELRTPGPDGWAAAAAIDAIRAHGTFGPLIQLRQNSAVGTRRGVVAHATNHARATTAGWRWAIADNAHLTAGAAVPETINW